MGIVFFCQSCGARFEVDPQVAGKKGRCKKCGQLVEIPRAEHLASMTATPTLASTGAGVKAGEAIAATSWLKDVTSNVGLAPLSTDQLPIGLRRAAPATPLDDTEDSKPYALAQPEERDRHARSSGRPNVLLMFWRGELGVFQRLFRRLNETAYLISVPFLMVLLFGIAVRSRPLALIGATVVVLLNFARIASGIANLAVVPFREGIDFTKMKKPFRRVVEPALTIGLVIVAFAFIPWLSRGAETHQSLTERLRSTTKSLEGEIEDEVEQTVQKARSADLEKLGAKAREKLRHLGNGPGENPRTPSPSNDPDRSLEAAGRGLIHDVGNHVRETIEESRQQP